jgi:hypothetical protein
MNQLYEFLSDKDSCDVLTLYELLLFPDETIQTLVESDLGNKEYTQSDLDEICRILHLQNLSIRLTFPDDRDLFCTTVPESAVIKFVQRLNILNRMDAFIDQTLIQCLADRADYLKARVRFRNRRFGFTEFISEFLVALIEKACLTPSFLWEALDYMMDFFNTYPAIKDIESALIEKRRACVELLNLEQTNKKALQENAVETLLMRGARIASGCIEEIEKEIDLIDDIRFTVYGKKENATSP